MRSVPLLLLLSSVLLSSHLRPAAGRPRLALAGWPDGGGRVQAQQQLEEMLKFLHKRGREPLRFLSPAEEDEEAAMEEEGDEDAGRTAKRREEPPLSIDLTFHLLRNMIHMANVENQREQAELNRRILDEIGK